MPSHPPSHLLSTPSQPIKIIFTPPTPYNATTFASQGKTTATSTAGSGVVSRSPRQTQYYSRGQQNRYATSADSEHGPISLEKYRQGIQGGRFSIDEGENYEEDPRCSGEKSGQNQDQGGSAGGTISRILNFGSPKMMRSTSDFGYSFGEKTITYPSQSGSGARSAPGSRRSSRPSSPSPSRISYGMKSDDEIDSLAFVSPDTSYDEEEDDSLDNSGSGSDEELGLISHPTRPEMRSSQSYELSTIARPYRDSTSSSSTDHSQNLLHPTIPFQPSRRISCVPSSSALSFFSFNRNVSGNGDGKKRLNALAFAVALILMILGWISIVNPEFFQHYKGDILSGVALEESLEIGDARRTSVGRGQVLESVGLGGDDLDLVGLNFAHGSARFGFGMGRGGGAGKELRKRSGEVMLERRGGIPLPFAKSHWGSSGEEAEEVKVEVDSRVDFERDTAISDKQEADDIQVEVIQLPSPDLSDIVQSAADPEELSGELEENFIAEAEIERQASNPKVRVVSAKEVQRMLLTESRMRMDRRRKWLKSKRGL